MFNYAQNDTYLLLALYKMSKIDNADIPWVTEAEVRLTVNLEKYCKVTSDSRVV